MTASDKAKKTDKKPEYAASEVEEAKQKIKNKAKPEVGTIISETKTTVVLEGERKPLESLDKYEFNFGIFPLICSFIVLGLANAMSGSVIYYLMFAVAAALTVFMIISLIREGSFLLHKLKDGRVQHFYGSISLMFSSLAFYMGLIGKSLKVTDVFWLLGVLAMLLEVFAFAFSKLHNFERMNFAGDWTLLPTSIIFSGLVSGMSADGSLAKLMLVVGLLLALPVMVMMVIRIMKPGLFGFSDFSVLHIDNALLFLPFGATSAFISSFWNEIPDWLIRLMMMISLLASIYVIVLIYFDFKKAYKRSTSLALGLMPGITSLSLLFSQTFLRIEASPRTFTFYTKVLSPLSVAMTAVASMYSLYIFLSALTDSRITVNELFKERNRGLYFKTVSFTGIKTSTNAAPLLDDDKKIEAEAEKIERKIADRLNKEASEAEDDAKEQKEEGKSSRGIKTYAERIDTGLAAEVEEDQASEAPQIDEDFLLK